MFARADDCSKKSASEMRIARAPSITKGYPLPEGSPGWLIATRVLEGRINFRAFSSVHRPTAAIPISPQQKEAKFFKASNTQGGPAGGGNAMVSPSRASAYRVHRSMLHQIMMAIPRITIPGMVFH